MTRRAHAFSIAVIGLGCVSTICSIFGYVQALPGMDLSDELQRMLCLIILCSICRSLPIYISRSYALDVSILSILASVLTQGPYAAVIVSVASAFFTFEYDETTRTHRHIFNTPPIKTAFNLANYAISILLTGMVIMRMGFVPGKLIFPQAVGYMTVYTLLSFLINASLFFGMFTLDGKIKRGKVFEMLIGLLPNVLAAMPLGLLTSILFAAKNGQWAAVVMLLPLLLARHAWKLYLESQVQYYRLIQAFASSMEARDKYTQGHSRRVTQYAELIARGLGMKKAQVETIRIAALLHDIGKIGIVDSILRKPDRLTDPEYTTIRQHPQIGVDIVEKVGLSQEIMEIIRHHHERYDGRGYPDGLSSAQISLAAQILTVADAYDAMTSERPYRMGIPQEVAFHELVEGKGSQFNPKVVDCFIEQLTACGGIIPEREDLP